MHKHLSKYKYPNCEDDELVPLIIYAPLLHQLKGPRQYISFCHCQFSTLPNIQSMGKHKPSFFKLSNYLKPIFAVYASILQMLSMLDILLTLISPTTSDYELVSKGFFNQSLIKSKQFFYPPPSKFFWHCNFFYLTNEIPSTSFLLDHKTLKQSFMILDKIPFGILAIDTQNNEIIHHTYFIRTKNPPHENHVLTHILI